MSKTVTLTAGHYAAILAGGDIHAAERGLRLQARAGLRSELGVLTTGRDLFRERLKLFRRRLIAARSETRDARQQDLFLNVTGTPTPGAAPTQESGLDSAGDISAHKRTRWRRKLVVRRHRA